MSTSNKKAGGLHCNDLNVTSVCVCQCVGQLCRCCLQLGDMAEGGSDPPEASKSAAVPSSQQPLLLFCFFTFCGWSESCPELDKHREPLSSLVLEVLLTPVLGGVGWFVTPPSLSVRPRGSRASNVTGIWGLAE